MYFSAFLERFALLLIALGVASHSALAVDITGAGATFPYPIYAKWADAYKQKTGIGLNYQSIGSGGGIKQDAAFLHDPSGARLQPRPAARRGLGRSRLRRGAHGRRAHTPAAPGARTHRTRLAGGNGARNRLSLPARAGITLRSGAGRALFRRGAWQLA